MDFAVGSLVKAREREWVVLPDSTQDLLILRPLGGSENEVTGIYLALEGVQPAIFDAPNPGKLGDHRSCNLLRQALRLGFRSSAGPFRSFANLGFAPRSYQLVPLLMALRLDPIRLLIADDVGIGKTVEAALIARELLDRGEVKRLAVLCPPHLAEQWQRELKAKFHIDAELVLAGTARRLESSCAQNESIFERYPHVIVSTDYIKATNRRDEFLRTCPELVIIDEAHTCAFGFSGKGGRHHRYDLVSGLAKDPSRHLILVTATPHSGKEEAFRSLLSFLNKDFENLPLDMMGEHNRKHREKLAAHLVQRRRVDIKQYLDEETKFPEREEKDATYKLSPEYKKLFESALAYARELAFDPSGKPFRRRVKWWSALGLLRALASSPEAAIQTFKNRGEFSEDDDPKAIDEYGASLVFDQTDEGEVIDFNPAADASDLTDDEKKNKARLAQMIKAASALKGKKDEKLGQFVPLLKGLLAEKFSPIVFCRFIATAHYLSEQLKDSLGKNVEIITITSELAPEEREARIIALDENPGVQRLLICTDCLSEGINLQAHFDAVVHYDLAWNPTRHEQREGRVDRFGQNKKVVRVLTYFGLDNQIDGIVLDVLIRKHKAIRSNTGVSVPIPVDTNQVIESIFEGLLLRENSGKSTPYLPGFEEMLKKTTKDAHVEWEKSAENEKKSRIIYAQHALKPELVASELAAVTKALGDEKDVRVFVESSISNLGGTVKAETTKSGAYLALNLRELPRSLREQLARDESFKAGFSLPPPQGVTFLPRTHPFVSTIASYLLESALDGTSTIAARAGAIKTLAVKSATTLLLLRIRYQLKGGRVGELLAEECRVIGFTGAPSDPKWLNEVEVEKLLTCEPSGNLLPEKARDVVAKVTSSLSNLATTLNKTAESFAQELLSAHTRVRDAAKIKSANKVEVKLPVDILGIYVYVPDPKGGS